ncbi:DNA polymerase-1 [Alkalibacillus flavidus]|uniref:DNA polymerase I n=1 Tax=Alkalibacillus flavidus TaxID=546021 RepID=A0ABV2KSR3_9BACI
MAKELVLIDGNSILYRSFFALPLLSNEQGVHTNAVFGFTKMLLKVFEDHDPSHILVAFDAGKTTFRHETYQEYKGGRQKTPPELSEQFPIVREVLDAFGVKYYELDQYEADDIIGTIVKEADNAGHPTTVYSGDKDLLQLASNNTQVSLTRKGVSEIETYTPETIQDKMGISKEQIIDLKALMGDQSDNIPGVPGVGEKTAVKLINQFGTVESIYDNLDNVSGKKLKEKLEANHDEAIMSKQLVTIKQDSPLEISLQDLNYSGYESKDVLEVFKTYGFQSLIQSVDGGHESSYETVDFEVIDDFNDVQLDSKANLLYMEMLDDNYHETEIIGFGLVNSHGTYMLPTSVLEQEAFRNFLNDNDQPKLVFNKKALVVALKWRGIEVQGIEFDLQLAAYIANPSSHDGNITSIANHYNVANVSYDEEIYGKGAKQHLPDESTYYDHIVRKAIAGYQLFDILQQELKQNEQESLYYQLEMPLSSILANMEYNGIKIDVERLQTMNQDLTERLDSIEKRIHELAGSEFNINSPKQLGKVLFEDLELPVIKKTKTGYSTSADVLEKLQHEHEIVDQILHYRQLSKLQSTYLEGLMKVVHEDNQKIHTRFNQVLTQTGRLSSVEPNLQNIPIRLEEGRKIRQAFIPSGDNAVLFAADYSQIELRVLAHIANDDKLIEAFNNGKDIHTQTAMDVFDVKEEEIDDLMRRQAKAVNFGIVYGISDYGLSQNLGISRKEAEQFINKYFESYPGVKQYMDDIVTRAKRDGYVETIMNRRRYLPDINSRNFNKRSFAERTAMNSPIQGSAADIIKQAMIDVTTKLAETDIQATMLLQVHDELIFDVAKEDVESLEAIVKEAMEQTVDLSVPLTVDYAYGDTWYDAK